MEAANLTLSLAFLAGLLSFASPCVLPLVPAYMGYLGGTAVIAGEQGGMRRETGTTFLHSLLFVLGFGLVFVLLGASATFIGQFLFESSILLQRVGGVLLVVFGMRLMAGDWNRERWVVAAVVVAVVTFVVDAGLLAQGRVEFGEYTVTWLMESVMMGMVVLAGAPWGTGRQETPGRSFVQPTPVIPGITSVILAVTAGVLNFLASIDLPVPNLAASILIVLAVILLNRTDLLYTERRITLKQASQADECNAEAGAYSGRAGYMRSLLFGVVFAAGWTPCVGPILAGILLVASQLETVGQGVALLAAYTLGLGIPFLLMGLAFGPLSRWLRRVNRYLGVVSIASGALLVLMGIFILTNSLTFLAQYGDFFHIEF
jgi:cytochrome c-type biogenesis protein